MTLPPLTRRQRDILAFYQDYTATHEISPTLEEIAQYFGLNKVTVFGHVAELERKGVLERAAKGISRGIRIAEEFQRETNQSGQLPILGRIAAGMPIAALEAPEVLAFEELAPPGKEVYVLRVEGDSMIEDSIRDGDLVIVERRHQARNGETVVAILGPGAEEAATLIRFYREPSGRIRLQPANASMAPMIVDDLEIRGVVIGVIRRY